MIPNIKSKNHGNVRKTLVVLLVGKVYKKNKGISMLMIFTITTIAVTK